MILQGSPAIDAGSPLPPGAGGNACAAVDQRGTVRPVDGDNSGNARCDIGAFEFKPKIVVVPPLGTFEVSPSDGGVAPNEQITYRFTWTVPAPRNWHELTDLEIRWLNGENTVLHIR